MEADTKVVAEHKAKLDVEVKIKENINAKAFVKEFVETKNTHNNSSII